MSFATAAHGAALRSTALLLLGSCAVVLLAGCSGKLHNQLELRLESADLRMVAGQLSSAKGPIRAEVAAARSAWPSLYDGLSATVPKRLTFDVAEAQARISRLRQPAFLNQIHTLTGPASGIGALFESFWGLSHQGWSAISATLTSIRHGPRSAARFRRANVAIYIQSVYDAHYDLSLIGASIQRGYERLGGTATFGVALTPTEVSALASFYSRTGVRLEPHPSSSLGLG